MPPLMRPIMLLLFAINPACLVSKSLHEACLADLEKSQQTLATTSKDRDTLNGKLTEAVGQNQQLVTKISSMGHNVDELLGEKDKLSQERITLSGQVEELTRLRAQALARDQDHRTLLDKLHKMIDAGTLQVRIRKGRMLVQMSSDLLFPPGGIRLRPEAKQAIIDLASTLKSFPDRRFEVVGHSDPTPISTARFPSNWELSAGRAIEMVKVLVEAGVPPEMLSAAGSAEYDPLETNDTPEHKLANRRVELVFLPKIEELPGFTEASTENPKPTNAAPAPGS